ncbi:MAG TPA: hypothetical protein VKU84_11335 [Stellaceae bacterium]|nr:hypothetical protein [Stellaceae bacterium]
MRLSLTGLVVLAAVALPLAGCGNGPPPRQEFADLRFTTEPPLRLNVASVEIQDEYRPDFDPPHFEQRFPIPLPHLADNWAHDRLQAVGTSGRAVAVVIDASAVEISLPKESGITTAFTDQPDTQYNARVGIRVEARDDRGMSTRMAEAHAERSVTTVEGTTLEERDRLLYQMESELMAELDHQLETQIRNNFGDLVE